MADQAYGLGCLFKNHEGPSLNLLVVASLCHVNLVMKERACTCECVHVCIYKRCAAAQVCKSCSATPLLLLSVS